MAVRLRKDRGLWQVDWRDAKNARHAKVFQNKKEAEAFDAFVKLQIKHDIEGLDEAIEKELGKSQRRASSSETKPAKSSKKTTTPSSQESSTRSTAQTKASSRKGRGRPEKNSLPVEEPPSPFATLETVAKAYLRDRQFTKDKSYSNFLDGMRIPLELFANKRIGDITRADLRQILILQKAAKKTIAGGRVKTDEPVSQATVAAKMRVLRTVMRWAVQNEYLETMPPFPKIPQPNYKKFVPPTAEEVQAIHDAAAPHIQRVVIIGAYFGVRVGECELLKIRWEDVDLKRAVLRVQSADKNPSMPWREVPIREELLPLFQKWQEEDSAVGAATLVHLKGKPLKRIERAWENAVARSGITRRIRPYDLRHAFATEAIAAGADIGTVASLMGHSSPQMLLNHYQHVQTVQKRKAVANLPMIRFDHQE